ncbi:MAG TPA: hypothetical protein VKE51_14955 [Vicinamibacterales bacterium]|nr:hypothetical protein [Vicinamibacterales bacterium]
MKWTTQPLRHGNASAWRKLNSRAQSFCSSICAAKESTNRRRSCDLEIRRRRDASHRKIGTRHRYTRKPIGVFEREQPRHVAPCRKPSQEHRQFDGVLPLDVVDDCVDPGEIEPERISDRGFEVAFGVGVVCRLGARAVRHDKRCDQFEGQITPRSKERGVQASEISIGPIDHDHDTSEHAATGGRAPQVLHRMIVCPLLQRF